MKHRHKLAQRQRQRPASPSRRADVNEDEQLHSSASKLNKSSMHSMRAEGGRTKLRLDKFRRGGRRAKRYDNGGPAGSSAASTRSADDPGGEIASANRGRKSTSVGYRTNGRHKAGLQARRSTEATRVRRRRRNSSANRVRFALAAGHRLLTQAKPPCGDDSKEYAASRYRRKSYGGAGGGCACLPAEKRPKLSRFTEGSGSGEPGGRADQTSAAATVRRWWHSRRFPCQGAGFGFWRRPSCATAAQ